MEKWELAKDVGTGLMVGAVATGLMRGFDVWTLAIAISGGLLLVLVIVRHKLIRNP